MANQLLINIAESLGLFRLSRFYSRHTPIILMYHRIVSEPLLPGITPEIFEQQLRYLKKFYRVVPMAQLAEEIRSQSVQPYSVAITFDDGHYDFYTNAWPLLRKYNLPASLYVTTGFIDQKCWLWPDLLRFLLLSTKEKNLNTSPIGPLSLTDNGVLSVWNKLGNYCLSLNAELRWQFLSQLAKQLNVTPNDHPEKPFNPVTWDQLREMQNQGLEVGSHSVTHPILSSLNYNQLTDELAVSHERIQQELGSPPKGICYPNGMAQDISCEVEKMSAEIYSYGLVAYPEYINHHNLFRLGRWAAPTKLTRFKIVMNSLSRNDNHRGEYK